MSIVPKIKAKPIPDLTKMEFLTLYPLYRLAEAAVAPGPNCDGTISKDDLLNGNNGVPQNIGMKMVFQLLTMSDDLRWVSADSNRFAITGLGLEAVQKYAQAKKEPNDDTI